MPCGCSGGRTGIRPPVEAVSAGDASSGARYTVLAPDPDENQTFDSYIEAAVYRRQVNGTLTTHT